MVTVTGAGQPGGWGIREGQVPGPKFPVDRDYPHFYSHVEVLKCLFEWAQVSDDTELMAFVQRGFEYGRKWIDSYIGYVGETIGTQFAETCESDGQPGMIALALQLSAAGVGDYWDDADRWLRNQFAESQMLHADCIERMVERQGLYPLKARPRWTQMIEPICYTADRVAERNVGAIVSAGSGNSGSPRSGNTGSDPERRTGGGTHCGPIRIPQRRSRRRRGGSPRPRATGAS